MLNKMKKKKIDELPSLERFKMSGVQIVDDMRQPLIVSLNIRNLKYFNEIYGTDKGDWLISRMVDYFCRNNDTAITGAMSYADHLLVLCEAGYESEAEVLEYYEKIADNFVYEVSSLYDRANVHVECGLYLMQPGDSFIYAQDNARYARKSMKGNYDSSVAFYSEDIREKSVKKAGVIPNFERAMKEDGIQIYLQPKCSAIDGRIVGAEALSRFYDADGQIISPVLYVPILEKAGIVSRLDYEVLKKTVKLLAKWKNDGMEIFPISVNLSRYDLMDEEYLDSLNKLVEDAGVEKKYIEFELTESVLVQDLDNIVKKLNHLREQGYRVALDDFGSGYNSLYMLGQIPANTIKFDRGFVLHSIDNEMGEVVLKNLIKTFKEISFEVLCEGVETEEEKEKILACGCEIIQGYLYDKPLNIIEFENKYVYD